MHGSLPQSMNRTRCAMLRVAPLLALAVALTADAWILTVSPGPKTVYLQVGGGSYTGFYNSGGTPLNNATINVVSVTVPATAVGRGTAQAMTSNSATSNSFYDNFAIRRRRSMSAAGRAFRPAPAPPCCRSPRQPAWSTAPRPFPSARSAGRAPPTATRPRTFRQAPSLAVRRRLRTSPPAPRWRTA